MEHNPEFEQTKNEIENQRSANGVITLVLTADNHLGYATSGLPPRKRELRKQQLRHAFQQATDFAIGQGVDLFVQAGDLFDIINPDEQDRSFVAERLAQLSHAGIKTLAVGGIHDTSNEAYSSLDGAKIDYSSSIPAPQLSYARLGALHYFTRPFEGAMAANPVQAQENRQLEPVVFDIRSTRVGICGVSVAIGQEGDPLEYLRKPDALDDAAITLLVLHAPIEGFASGSTSNDVRAQVNRASIANQSIFRYILAGYHHAYRHVSIGQSDVVIAGVTQHINFDDPDDDPGFIFLGLAADGVRWCEHIAVESLQLRRLVISARELMQNHSPSEQDEEIDITENVLQRLRPLCSEDAMVQLRLEGELTREDYHKLDLNQIRRFGEEHCFALSIDDSALSFLSELENISSVDGHTHGARREERFSPREELITMADEWIAAAPDEAERKALLATKEELLIALRHM